MIKIWCWENGEIDPGHIAIQLNDHIYGFTFEGEKYPGPAVGEMKKESENQLAEWYVKHHIKEYMRRAGKKGADANPGSREVSVFEVAVPKEAYVVLLERYEAFHKDPPVYDRPSVPR